MTKIVSNKANDFCRPQSMIDGKLIEKVLYDMLNIKKI